MVVADVSGAHAAPTHDPLVSLVHYLTPADIEHVLVDGDRLVQAGTLPEVDTQRLMSDTQRVHDKMGRIFTDWLGEDRPEEAFLSVYPVDPEFDRSQ